MEEREMHRKVTRIGNNLGVSMTEALKSIGANAGDHLIVKVINNEIRIQKKKQMDVPDGIDSEFFEILQEGMEEYHNTLKGLRNR
ncbi:AbrB family transcriptional regulator [Salicibibacter kimchii]|uniref:AbrB family transcriptional regulator n=1 Tax=Salicibibacter kimchii TaxID=2099786 RepID=A0A345BXA3_9BACI|nr:AbrB family transcriptional regulator [Salicibibacter kimchii]AXF55584.1 AbrB family transcriptional regulator [Salicibibacter kimchii]